MRKKLFEEQIVNVKYCTGLTEVAQWLKKKKKSACQCRRPSFHPSVGKIPWRRKWQPTPVFLPGCSHGQSSLAGYSPWGCKESDTTEHTHTTHCTGLSQTIVDIANIYWGFLGSTIFCQAHLMCRLTLYNIPKK